MKIELKWTVDVNLDAVKFFDAYDTDTKREKYWAPDAGLEEYIWNDEDNRERADATMIRHATEGSEPMYWPSSAKRPAWTDVDYDYTGSRRTGLTDDEWSELVVAHPWLDQRP